MYLDVSWCEAEQSPPCARESRRDSCLASLFRFALRWIGLSAHEWLEIECL